LFEQKFWSEVPATSESHMNGAFLVLPAEAAAWAGWSGQK